MDSTTGAYKFTNLPVGGNYTVTPSNSRPCHSYVYDPPSRTFNNLSANEVADFTEREVGPSISGQVFNGAGAPVPGITVTLDLGARGTTQTDANGRYSFINLTEGGFYRVSPSSAIYGFSPGYRDFFNLTGNNNTANFTTIPLYTIGGRAVDRSGAAIAGATDANFNCNPNTPGQATGVASRKCDYHIAVGTLRFAAGEESKQFNLSIVNDVYVEGDESFTLSLSNPTGAILGQNRSVQVAITDDDGPNKANPISDTQFYVRQLYVDLLSREPDPAGWSGWTSRIDLCGQPDQALPPCDRVTVGGDGFLRSGEFFDRQFFVLRLYRMGLGRILRYDEIADLAYVSRFLTAEQLELNKQDLVNEMVLRAEFANRYNPLGSSAFVATLLQTAAVSVPQVTQDGWVTSLTPAARLVRRSLEKSRNEWR